LATPPQTSTLFPYTTLFRSLFLARPAEAQDVLVGDHRVAERVVLVIIFDDRAGQRRAFLDPELFRERAGDDVAHHHFDRHNLDLDRKSTRLNSSHVEISYAV